MTAASHSRRPSFRARAGTSILAGIVPARMPLGSAFHAPVLVGYNGDVQ
jgi:hypothetical protein